MNSEEQAALDRLIAIAQGHTGQSKCVADFLLAWWNSASCGGFDLTILWGVDSAIAKDMAVVGANFCVVAEKADEGYFVLVHGRVSVC